MVPPGPLWGFLPVWVIAYPAALVALGLHAFLLYYRFFRLLALGRWVNRFHSPPQRLLGALLIVLGQRKVLQSVSFKWRDLAGLTHASIFLGFLSFVVSYILLIFGDSAWERLSETLLTPAGLRVFTVYLDILAAVVLAALTWALLRRWVGRPHRLTFDLTRSADAIVIVALIASLMLLTLLTEAAYVAKGGAGPHASAPIGGALGRAFQALGMGLETATALHGASWWVHYLIILAFAIYIPFSKHMHMVAAPLNAFFRRLEPSGTLDAIRDIEKQERFGAGGARDLTWKQILDGFACAVCGRCTDNCPANISGKVLSPMHIVEDLKGYLLKHRETLVRGREPAEPIIGGAVPLQAVWDCVTCGACVYECPVTVEHIDPIVDMRRHLVMERAEIPETALNALQCLEQRGHPWRGTRFTRTDWAKGLGVKTVQEEPEPEVLLWVGCTPALEQRSQGPVRALARLLQRAGIRFAILGEEEACTGDPARRLGNEYLFQVLAQRNIETLQRYNVRKVLTLCPHCFNTLKNEYHQFGGRFEVVHAVQFIADLLRQGRLKPLKRVEVTMAYHDSCYLGRHNGVYEPPREIAKAIPGLQLREMRRCREKGFCCGAGGGHMWLEEVGGRRINHIRTEQFLATGAKVVGVSCPFCLQMLKEGIEAAGQADCHQAQDLLELLEQSVGEDGREVR